MHDSVAGRSALVVNVERSHVRVVGLDLLVAETGARCIDWFIGHELRYASKRLVSNLSLGFLQPKTFFQKRF